MAKIAFFNRSSIHYRKNIYMLMDKELCVDFYFGDSRPGKIEPVDESLLQHSQPHLHNVVIGPFYWQKGVLSLLRKNYDTFITPGDTYCISTWLFMILAKLKGKKVFMWSHGAYGNEKGLRLLLRKWSEKLATGTFLYGTYAKDILVNHGVPEEKLHVIYNSLAYDEQMEIRKSIQPSMLYKEHFNNDHKNIVFVGRLTKIKKLDQILKAVALLKKRKQNYNVTLIGDGTEKQILEKLVHDLGLDNVWFYGACYDEKMLCEMLFNADICVSPGNVGLTAMHTMTFGTPVISHNNFSMQMPEFEAIEEGKTGTFFKEDDINSLVEAIERWFNLGVEREDVRKACYKVIDEKYNPHVQIETMKKVIYNY